MEDKEQVYDEQIYPLMNQIIAIAKEHRIPIAFQAQLNDNDGGYFCTTMLFKGFNGNDEHFERVLKAMKPPKEFSTFVITTNPT